MAAFFGAARAGVRGAHRAGVRGSKVKEGSLLAKADLLKDVPATPLL